MLKNELFFKPAKIDEIISYAKRISDEVSSGDIGYYHLPDLGGKILDELGDFSHTFNSIVLIGIGGSSVGVRAIFEMLKDKINKNIKFHILDNLDNFTFNEVINSIEFSNTLFIISSKSGTTIETISLFKVILDKFKPKNLKDNFIFITDFNSPLENFAKENDAKFYNIPKNVGGRFSILSAIGIVPLTLLGLDMAEILRGAKDCKDRFLKDKDPLILQKAYHYATHKNATINVIFSYIDRLKFFNEWYIQLWAESLGKKRGYIRYGLTPAGVIGSKDQHSFLQLIMDGVLNKSVSFIKVLDHGLDCVIPNLSLSNLENTNFANGIKMQDLINFQCDATMRAVINEGISVDLITLDKLDEYHTGYILYYYELLTSVTGAMLGINTYDQPGVEAGKRILKSLILKE